MVITNVTYYHDHYGYPRDLTRRVVNTKTSTISMYLGVHSLNIMVESNDGNHLSHTVFWNMFLSHLEQIWRALIQTTNLKFLFIIPV